jgi:hypothetical protein
MQEMVKCFSQPNQVTCQKLEEITGKVVDAIYKLHTGLPTLYP